MKKITINPNYCMNLKSDAKIGRFLIDSKKFAKKFANLLRLDN